MGNLEPGAVLSGHRIESVIGRGGMGVVYLATHLALDRRVALKVIDPAFANDPAYRARFRREARLAAAIEHPGVVTIHHAGEDDGLLYISMSFVDGPDLRAVLDKGALAPARGAEIVAALASALDAAHERGLIHRDVKPANVLLAGDRVVLTDFGVTRLAGAGTTVTGTGQWVGTADYMAPEQALGRDVDRRADVYSLACLLYETLAGRVPFVRDNALATLAAHMHEPPPRPSDADRRLKPFDPVVLRGMAKRPEDRFATAGDLGRAASAAAPAADGGAAATALAPPPTTRPSTTPAPTAPAPTGPAPTRPPSRRRRLAWAAGAAAVLAAAAVAVVALLAGGDDAGDEPAGSACASPITIGANPTHVVVGHGSVWTTDAAAGAVRRLDPTSCEEIAAIEVGPRPAALASGPSGVWVGDDGSGDLGRIDPETNRYSAVARDAVQGPRGLVARGGMVWAIGLRSGSLARLDAFTGRPLGEPTDLGEDPRSIAYSAEALWVTLAGEDRVVPVSAASGAVLDPTGGPIGVGENPRGVGGSEDFVWVVSWDDGTLRRVDSHKGLVSDPIRVGTNPLGVAVGEGSVWVTNNADGTVSRVDPDDLTVIDTIPVGRRPRGVTVGGGAVWVVNGADGTLTRIDPEAERSG